jgi:ABC-type Fe3+ transport system permease subunit
MLARMTFPTAASYPEQSQATTILVLGILGLICCAPLGIAAWIMGNKELEAIDAGLRNPENRGTANAGRIIGIVATVLLALGLVVFLASLVLGFSIAGFESF